MKFSNMKFSNMKFYFVRNKNFLDGTIKDYGAVSEFHPNYNYVQISAIRVTTKTPHNPEYEKLKHDLYQQSCIS